MNIPVKIRRQASRTSAPRFETYTVDCDPKSNTILDVLNRIQWEQDGSLVFRRNCRNAICGSCAMRVNGRAVLACQKLVVEELEARGELVIAPMGNLPVVKDLVVDMTQFWQGVKRVDPYVSTASRQISATEYLQTPEQRTKLEEAANCILCGACYSECNSVVGDANFVGPHALAKAYRVWADNRDDRTQERIQQYTQPGFVWDCTRCFNCNEVCPVGVQPLDRITQIKQEILKHSELPETTPLRHRHTMVELVKEGGWIDERKFGLKVVSNNGRDVKGLLSLIPLGLRMLLCGKLPAPWRFHPSEGAREVRAVIIAVERARDKT
ncbi:succinate dehydrogenase/fumarate reductase iron-sulfur subunit [Anthocerotibacter panamensis]|uniref:succinate dehydrogenase/fumarate reductase iron-sulfur subunit n=1 Tax=Anthocerotibacter panamensis TaxID=2857077 RepID=UPI001C403A4F|nr:succinate dehydrogenase/fumarate reductase iron-sulfur subunit [Anthocerotibacter panamensis]